MSCLILSINGVCDRDEFFAGDTDDDKDSFVVDDNVDDLAAFVVLLCCSS